MFDLILIFSGISFLILSFQILMMIFVIIGIKIFEMDYRVFYLSSFISAIIFHSTFVTYFQMFEGYKYFAIIFLIILLFAFLVPMVKFGFPDVTFPGRSYLSTGMVLVLLVFLEISFFDFSFINIFSYRYLLFLSLPFSAWMLLGFILNPSRLNKVLRNVFLGETNIYVEGDYS